jgi:hypothetical protein
LHASIQVRTVNLRGSHRTSLDPQSTINKSFAGGCASYLDATVSLRKNHSELSMCSAYITSDFVSVSELKKDNWVQNDPEARTRLGREWR